MGKRSWESLIGELYGLRRFGIEPGLDRMLDALLREGSPSKSYEIVTVGGTNGKGSVASLVAAILQAHGVRVGLYTSPHLIDVSERFRVNGVPLSRQRIKPTLGRLLDVYGRKKREQGAVGLTFFEITTLTAAVLFAEEDVDVAIFEVGLGGRLDAVNAMDPSISVVTTIGLDHTDYLGEKIEDIAFEKAGIFRSGVPAVLGAQEVPAARRILLAEAQRQGAVVVDTTIDASPGEEESIKQRHRRTAESAVRTVLGDKVSREHCARGVSQVRWPGRFDEISLGGTDRRWMLDAAHNPAAVRALENMIQQRERPLGAVIWGGMRDKDPAGVQRLLQGIGAPVWGALIDDQRARDVEALRDVIPRQLWRGGARSEKLVETVRDETDGDVLVFGSVYLVGEIYHALGWTPQQLVTYVGD